MSDVKVPGGGLGRWRGRLGQLVLLLVALIAPVVVCPPSRAAAANGQDSPLASTPVVTYNMDGANSADSKWTTTIGPLIARAQIVLLQEAGSGPPGAPAEANQVFHNVPGAGIGDAGVVRHHRWQHDGDFSEVYFLQTDRNNGTYVGNRVNLAIVTHDDADEVTVLRNPQTNSRPFLGVRFGRNWYFTYHAQALGPDAWHVAMGEVEDVLQAAQDFVTRRGRGETWFVGGDFNVQPAEGAAGDRYAMRMPTVDPNSGRTATMYQPHFQPTHQSGRTLDYATAWRWSHAWVRFPGTWLTSNGSCEPSATSSTSSIRPTATGVWATATRRIGPPRVCLCSPRVGFHRIGPCGCRKPHLSWSQPALSPMPCNRGPDPISAPGPRG